MLSRAKALALKAGVNVASVPPAAETQLSETTDGLVEEGQDVGILSTSANPDIRSLQQLLIYGLKGMAAYADHAPLLGRTDNTVFAFIHEALASLTDPSQSMEELLGLCMKCGEVNVRTMELLDSAHTERFGHPQPVSISTRTRDNRIRPRPA